MLPRLSSNARPILLHLLPDFRAGAPLAFILDLVRKLPEYSHRLLTNRPVAEVPQYQDELCTKLHLDVRYTAQHEIRRDDVEACRPDVIIAYDVRASDLADPIDTAPYIYYGHYLYDELPGYGCSAHVFGNPDVGTTVSPSLYFPPYVDHSLVLEISKKPLPPTRKRAVAILSGRPESFDFEFAAGVINGVDLKRVGFILPRFPTKAGTPFHDAVIKARENDSAVLCEHVPGSTLNAYRRTQLLLSTGCFRIEAELGVLRRPVARPDSVEEAVEIVNESLVGRKLIDELIDQGRQLALDRQLSLHIHKFSNLVRRLY